MPASSNTKECCPNSAAGKPGALPSPTSQLPSCMQTSTPAQPSAATPTLPCPAFTSSRLHENLPPVPPSRPPPPPLAAATTGSTGAIPVAAPPAGSAPSPVAAAPLPAAAAATGGVGGGDHAAEQISHVAGNGRGAAGDCAPACLPPASLPPPSQTLSPAPAPAPASPHAPAGGVPVIPPGVLSTFTRAFVSYADKVLLLRAYAKAAAATPAPASGTASGAAGGLATKVPLEVFKVCVQGRLVGVVGSCEREAGAVRRAKGDNAPECLSSLPCGGS